MLYYIGYPKGSHITFEKMFYNFDKLVALAVDCL
jgi:hypothetical protein